MTVATFVSELSNIYAWPPAFSNVFFSTYGRQHTHVFEQLPPGSFATAIHRRPRARTPGRGRSGMREAAGHRSRARLANLTRAIEAHEQPCVQPTSYGRIAVHLRHVDARPPWLVDAGAEVAG